MGACSSFKETAKKKEAEEKAKAIEEKEEAELRKIQREIEEEERKRKLIEEENEKKRLEERKRIERERNIEREKNCDPVVLSLQSIEYSFQEGLDISKNLKIQFRIGSNEFKRNDAKKADFKVNFIDLREGYFKDEKLQPLLTQEVSLKIFLGDDLIFEGETRKNFVDEVEKYQELEEKFILKFKLENNRIAGKIATVTISGVNHFKDSYLNNYDAVINVDSFKKLINGSWDIKFEKGINIVELSKKVGLVISFIGFFKTGKTYLMNRLCNAKFREGHDYNTNGIAYKFLSFKQDGTVDFTHKKSNERYLLLDSAGWNMPLNEVTDTNLKLLSVQFMQDFLLNKSDIIIFSTHYMTLEEFKFLNSEIMRIPANKTLIIIHNFMMETKRDRLDNLVKCQILNNFLVTPIERSLSYQDQEIKGVFYEGNTSERDCRILHFVLGKEGSEEIQSINDFSIGFIKQTIFQSNLYSTKTISPLKSFEEHLDNFIATKALKDKSIKVKSEVVKDVVQLTDSKLTEEDFIKLDPKTKGISQNFEYSVQINKDCFVINIPISPYYSQIPNLDYKITHFVITFTKSEKLINKNLNFLLQKGYRVDKLNEAEFPDIQLFIRIPNNLQKYFSIERTQEQNFKFVGMEGKPFKLEIPLIREIENYEEILEETRIVKQALDHNNDLDNDNQIKFLDFQVRIKSLNQMFKEGIKYITNTEAQKSNPPSVYVGIISDDSVNKEEIIHMICGEKYEGPDFSRQAYFETCNLNTIHKNDLYFLYNYEASDFLIHHGLEQFESMKNVSKMYENLIKDFCSTIIYVTYHINFSQMLYLKDLALFCERNGKKLFVIHYIQNINTLEGIENKINQCIIEPFNVEKVPLQPLNIHNSQIQKKAYQYFFRQSELVFHYIFSKNPELSEQFNPLALANIKNSLITNRNLKISYDGIMKKMITVSEILKENEFDLNWEEKDCLKITPKIDFNLENEMVLVNYNAKYKIFQQEVKDGGVNPTRSAVLIIDNFNNDIFMEDEAKVKLNTTDNCTYIIVKGKKIRHSFDNALENSISFGKIEIHEKVFDENYKFLENSSLKKFTVPNYIFFEVQYYKK